MPSLAFRKASICSRFSFSASCTLVVNPQHATRSRLILYWKLPPPSGSSCIGKDSVSKNSPSTPTISVTLPPGKIRWRRLSEWPDNAGKSSNAWRLPRANAGWITTRFATGKVGTGTSRWPCWPMLCCRCCAHAEKKTPNAQVRLSVPELRHLLTALLWRGWHGIEHLLHWSHWRRHHQFHAMTCHYRKRGSPLPVFYLQL